MKCEYCKKTIEKIPVVFDLLWLTRKQTPDEEVIVKEKDKAPFCDIDCLVKWQKKEGIYEAAKARSIERSQPGLTPAQKIKRSIKGNYRQNRSS